MPLIPPKEKLCYKHFSPVEEYARLLKAIITPTFQDIMTAPESFLVASLAQAEKFRLRHKLRCICESFDNLEKFDLKDLIILKTKLKDVTTQIYQQILALESKKFIKNSRIKALQVILAQLIEGITIIDKEIEEKRNLEKLINRPTAKLIRGARSYFTRFLTKT